MERQTKPQDVYVSQRRWVTVFFALLALIFFMAFVLLPIAYKVSPSPDMSEESRMKVLILFSVVTVLFAPPLGAVSVALFIKLARKYVIVADERGLWLYSTLVPYGLIPWSNIKSVQYFGVFDFSSAILAPDTNHLKIELKSKVEFRRGLNLLQRVYYRLNFSSLFCQMILCKGKGKKLAEALKTCFNYYNGTGENGSEE